MFVPPRPATRAAVWRCEWLILARKAKQFVEIILLECVCPHDLQRVLQCGTSSGYCKQKKSQAIRRNNFVSVCTLTTCNACRSVALRVAVPFSYNPLGLTWGFPKLLPEFVHGMTTKTLKCIEAARNHSMDTKRTDQRCQPSKTSIVACSKKRVHFQRIASFTNTAFECQILRQQ